MTEADLFEVQRFEIRPVIDVASPCFIDLEDARFPGLHVTEYANKVMEQTGITDPFNPRPGAPSGDVTDVLDAKSAMDHLGPLQGRSRRWSATRPSSTGPSATTCIEQRPRRRPDPVPAAQVHRRSSNAAAPRAVQGGLGRPTPESYYEGSDKVFTLPLNGKLYGMVEGSNPVNGVTVGGSGVFVDEALDGFDSFTINWQYKDLNGDGQPDYPAGTADADKSPTGYVYMSGTPVRAARGVINVHLTNPNDPVDQRPDGHLPRSGQRRSSLLGRSGSCREPSGSQP